LMNHNVIIFFKFEGMQNSTFFSARTELFTILFCYFKKEFQGEQNITIGPEVNAVVPYGTMLKLRITQ